MEAILLRTPRLLLRSTTPQVAAADLNDRRVFPLAWRAHSAGLAASTQRQYFQGVYVGLRWQKSRRAGWAAWYFLLPASKDEPTRAIGIGGFKGKPSPEGVVEVGYSIMPQYQRRGFACEAVAASIEWAFSHSEVTVVTAETLSELVPSIRVLEKSGFHFVGAGSEEGVIRYERGKRTPH